MNILYVTNERQMAGAVRARMFTAQYDDIFRELSLKGFNVSNGSDISKEPHREFTALDPVVSGDYDAFETINSIQDALTLADHQVTRVDLSDMARVYVEMASGSYDKVFNYAEGLSVLPFDFREVEIPMLASLLGVSHTGSDPVVAQTIFDKSKTARRLQFCGIRTPSTVSVVRGDQYKGPFPVFVKPQFQGSGVGIDSHSIVHTSEDLEKVVYSKVVESLQPVIVQPFLRDAEEMTVALLPYNGQVVVFPPLKVETHLGVGYGYEDKYGEHASKVRYSLVDDVIYCAEAMDLSKRVYTGLGIKGFARVDLMKNVDGVSVIEVNQPAGLCHGSIDVSYVVHDPFLVLADDVMSDFPKAVLASVHDPRFKYLNLPPVRSYVHMIDAIVRG